MARFPRINQIQAARLLLVLATCSFSFSFHHPYQAPKLLLTAVFLVTAASKVGSISPHSAPRPLFCVLLGWAVLSFFWSTNREAYLDGLAPLMLYLPICVGGIPADEPWRRMVKESLAISGALSAAYGLLQTARLDLLSLDSQDQAVGFWGNANFTAHFLLLSLMLGRFPAGRSGVIIRGLLCLGIAAAGSRGVWIAMALWGCLAAPPQWRRVVVTALLFFALGLGVLMRHDLTRGFHYAMNPDSYGNALKEQPALIVDREPWFKGKRYSLMTRVVLMGNSFFLARDHALTGVGLNQFQIGYAGYARAWINDFNMSGEYRARSSHNLVLDAVAGFGLPWLLLFLWAAWRYYKATDDKALRHALLLQCFIALFSLNFLNPLIIFYLLALGPTGGKVNRRVRIGAACIALLGIAAWTFLLDLPRTQQHTSTKTIPSVCHGMLTAYYFDRGQMDEALRNALYALDEDPYGPETLYNVGAILQHLGERDKAIAVYRWNLFWHPYYLPATLRLKELAVDGHPPDENTLAEMRPNYARFRLTLTGLASAH